MNENETYNIKNHYGNDIDKNNDNNTDNNNGNSNNNYNDKGKVNDNDNNNDNNNDNDKCENVKSTREFTDVCVGLWQILVLHLHTEKLLS